ncbi:MAG: hypothetical protein MK135_14720 [Polyangiaceae bacterium]|nr:hypothetical protein [Polyangiaceae bacterium]
MFSPAPISLSSDFLQAALGARGGFAWWYLDHIDEQGNGFVLIWSFGLPFLPHSRKRPTAGSRPSIALSLYRQGKCIWYTLQEFDPSQVSQPDVEGNLKIGDCSFQVERRETNTVGAIRLRLAAAGEPSPLEGVIEFEGPSVPLEKSQTTEQHLWTPRVPRARVKAQFSQERLAEAFEGPGYFDGNASTVSLLDQKIARWDWARITFPDETLITYTSTSETDGAVVGGAWRTKGQEIEVPAADEQKLEAEGKVRGFYRLDAPERLNLSWGSDEYSIHYYRLIDDGPFYQRYWLKAVRNGSSAGEGIAEVVCPRRIDIAWQRPFVRMRTHAVQGGNSPFLPLFSGPLDKTWSRLPIYWWRA